MSQGASFMNSLGNRYREISRVRCTFFKVEVARVGQAVTYNVTATFGEAEVVYELFWGDTYLEVYYKPAHEDHTTDHVFYEVGVYSAKLFVKDPAVNFEAPSVPVYIRNPMGGFDRTSAGPCWRYYPGTLSYSQVTATHLGIGHP